MDIGDAAVETGDFTMAELIRAVSKLKHNKSPGPAGIPLEFFKFLDAENLQLLLGDLNRVWQSEVMPEAWKDADLIALYKKGP
eukprot:5804988-Alexandrium_andersonii.AAC.1